MENTKKYEVKTIENGWVRLENYRDGYVVAIKKFQGVCVVINNFSSQSIHGYSLADIEKDKGDWNYIFNEKLLENVDGDIELERALERYNLTSDEISEVLHFNFDNRGSEEYKQQVIKIENRLKEE
ncbi:hypothetical protein [Listeria seeligeri]|uniref:hypothetical protein n=1 Tax=Listeria seeligeri TaxID=1640 RepID=UPI0016276736|nr:hypothetical protein [Listeria seeligeri]MBC1817164.1 hypothetical protein [Listeria seeligeri]